MPGHLLKQTQFRNLESGWVVGEGQTLNLQLHFEDGKHVNYMA